MNKVALSSDERKDLLSRHKSERDKRIADRIKVVLLSDDGWSVDRISKALFIDISTVLRHINTYLNEVRLSPNYKGSEPILNKAESEELASHLEENLYLKVKDIRDYIQKAYGKVISRSGVYNWLRNNNFTYKKPKTIPLNPDVSAQERFIEEYNSLMNEVSINGEPVLFGDSVHPSQQTRPSYGWIRKGKEHVIEVSSARKRVNIMGALNLENMSLVYRDFETINSLSTIEFFKYLESKYPNSRRIHLILDNAGYHTSEEVKEYLKTSRIKVKYLPPRCPNLNSIEPLWKVMHEYVSNNKVYKRFKDFKNALLEFFDVTFPNIALSLISRITDNFRIIYPAN